MPETGYFAVFLIGLLGGVHCVGMCGGIVSALTVQVRLPGQTSPARREWPLHLAYNLGRIGSYTAAGAAMGAIGTVGMLFNDDLVELRKIADFVAGLHCVTLVNLLPFHRSGLHKYERLGQVHGLHGVAVPSEELMAGAADVFRVRGLPTKIGG